MRRSIAATAVVVAFAAGAPLLQAQSKTAPGCDADNAGLTLPAGFCAGVFAKMPSPRHIAVAENGDVFVISNPGGGRGGSGPQRGVYRFRDANHNGKADSSETTRIADGTGSGVWVTKDALYAEDQGARPTIAPGAQRLPPPTMIVRYPFRPGTTDLSGVTDTIVAGLPGGGHSTRDFVIRGDELYVNVGSASNACTQGGGRDGAPITQPDPCPELPTRAGIWLYSATKKNQAFDTQHRFVTGVRNGVGISLNPRDNQVYSTQHGRDDLAKLGGQTQDYSNENPGEEFFKLTTGKDYGWPYCYYSHVEKKMVLAPEHGGDGTKVGRCATVEQPMYAFPGHWAPNASMFYTGSQFPAEYREGVFVAFHGSWNRGALGAPEDQRGFNVAFLPMKGDKANGAHKVFADGFRHLETTPPQVHRPAGLGQSKDGSLLVSDDQMGFIYRIVYAGR